LTTFSLKTPTSFDRRWKVDDVFAENTHFLRPEVEGCGGGGRGRAGGVRGRFRGEGERQMAREEERGKEEELKEKGRLRG